MAKDFRLDITKFTGLDLSFEDSGSLGDGKSPDMVNLQITPDYHLKRRSGFFSVNTRYSDFRGIYYTTMGGVDKYLAVVGKKFYHAETSFVDLTAIKGEVPGTDKVTFFPFHGKVYLLTGCGIMVYDGETLAELEPHIPTLMISTAPDGSGVLYEDANLLTRKAKQFFCGDGESYKFIPVVTHFSAIDHVIVDGRELAEEEYYWDDIRFELKLTEIPTRGIDNVEIQFEIEGEDMSHLILNCRHATAFGGASDTRSFLYGNIENPAVRYHSGIIDGKPCFGYFPETAVSLVGNGEEITSILCHYDRQLIFTTCGAYYSYLEYMTGVDGVLNATFPIFPLHDQWGNRAMGQAVLVENTPFTLTEHGLIQWTTTNIQDERNAQSVSQPIDRALREEKAASGMLFNCKEQGELYLCFGKKCYVYNYRLKLFYFYDFHAFPPLNFIETPTGLFFCSGKSVFKMKGDSDEGKKITTRWRSRLFDFANPSLQKKLFGVTLYMKAENGVDFAFGVREDQKELSGMQNFSVPAGIDRTKKRIAIYKRRFGLLEIRFETEGMKPFSIGEISLKGRITDREDL